MSKASYDPLSFQHNFTIIDNSTTVHLREHWGTVQTDNGEYSLSRSLAGDVVVIHAPTDHPVLKGASFHVKLEAFLDDLVAAIDRRTDAPAAEED